MTLTTHAIVGAAIASLVPAYPLAGFVLAFGSHFALDSIPHWDESSLLSALEGKEAGRPLEVRVRNGKALLQDIAIVGADSALGFTAAIAILFGLFHAPIYIVLLGALAGQTPDGLQFVYWTLQPRFMQRLQTFHSRIQTQHPDTRLLLTEAGIIFAVTALGILGVFML